jgi:carboxyl-terminal processing protease
MVLPSLSGVAEVGEAELQDPLPWDRISPSDYVREDHVSPFMKELRAKSATRVAEDKDFTYLREDIAQFKKNLTTQAVSLNEADRRRENEAAEAREASRKQELAALKESQPITYNITVENADTSGLPAPVTTLSAPATKLSASVADKTNEAETSIPPSDPALRESEHIMADYVEMLQQSPAVVVAAH